MNRYDKMLHEIMFEMKMKKITRKHLSAVTGVSQQSLSFFFNNKKSSNALINKICNYVENYRSEEQEKK